MKVKPFKATELVNDITLVVTITGMAEHKIRVAIGAWFIRIGARIIGCGVNIE